MLENVCLDFKLWIGYVLSSRHPHPDIGHTLEKHVLRPFHSVFFKFPLLCPNEPALLKSKTGGRGKNPKRESLKISEDWLKKPGWWFGTWILFSHILGIIIPIDSYVFRGVETTNQKLSDLECGHVFFFVLFCLVQTCLGPGFPQFGGEPGNIIGECVLLRVGVRLKCWDP